MLLRRQNKKVAEIIIYIKKVYEIAWTPTLPFSQRRLNADRLRIDQH